jgi:aldose 1-epimerase
MTSNCSVETTNRDGVEIVTLRDRDVYAEIAPALGNNCFSFVAGEPVFEPVAYDEFRAKPTSYGVPIMLPFPNRIRDGRFSFKGESYSIDPPRHGMVRDKPWQVVETGASDGGAWVTSRIDAADHPDRILAQFPFRFVADVTFGLVGSSLDMVTVVTNAGDREMPFGFGIHPYFRRPASGQLTVPANARWELESSLPTGKLLDVAGDYDLRKDRDVASLELDDVYTWLEPDTDGLVHCAIRDLSAQTATVIDFDAKEFPNVVVYTAPRPREALCVEPQTCPTDAFNLTANGVDANMIVLAPGETRRFTIRIRARVRR